MGKYFFSLALRIVIILFISCSSTQKFLLKDPVPGMSLLVGAVLVENVGVDDVYEAITSKINVIVVGKSIVEGKEVIQGYRLKTDEKGYFALANVPPGSYVVKGIEVDLGYGTRMLLTSRWEGNTQIYYPIDTMIDYTVNVWPPAMNGKFINLKIRYFHIDAANRVFDQIYNRLEDTPLNLNNVRHTMPDPLEYFQMKFPNSGWF